MRLMTKQGYFALKEDDATEIQIFNDGLYRIKGMLQLISHSDAVICWLKIDQDKIIESYSQENSTIFNQNHCSTHHFDIVFDLKQNQCISFMLGDFDDDTDTENDNQENDGDNHDDSDGGDDDQEDDYDEDDNDEENDKATTIRLNRSRKSNIIHIEKL